jgi:hypothetical protein
VESTPKWAKQLEGEMSLGKHVLEFRARSPLTNQTAACQMVLHVKDTEPPRVSTCPHSFVDYLGRYRIQYHRIVPCVFVHITKSKYRENDIQSISYHKKHFVE